MRPESEHLGDEVELLEAMRDSARLVAYSGDFERARREHVEVKRRAAAAGEPGMEAAMTVNLGVLAQQSGDFRGGLEYQTEAAALFRELGDTMVIVAVMNSGWCALGLGDVVLADSSFRKGLEMAGAAGTINRIADGALGLGLANAMMGENERGAQLLGAAESLREELGKEGRFDDELEEELHTRAIADARAALGEEAFAAAWARGRAMSPEEIIEFTVNAVDESSAPTS